MTSYPLLSLKFRFIGLLTVASTLLTSIVNGIYNTHTSWYINFPVVAYEEPFGEKNYFAFARVAVYDTVICLLFFIGLMFIAFSKIKKEDEYSYSIRLSSWLWAVWINCIFMVLSFVFFYGMSFFAVMVCNIYSMLIIFILRFYYQLYKSSKLKTI